MSLSSDNEKKEKSYWEYLRCLNRQRTFRLSAVEARLPVWGSIYLELTGRSPALRPARIVREIFRREAEVIRAAGYGVSLTGEAVRIGLVPVAGRRKVRPYRSARLINDAPYPAQTPSHLRGVFDLAEDDFFYQLIHAYRPINGRLPAYCK
jgi:hypothetical protein